MLANHDSIMQAIEDLNEVLVTFVSKDDGLSELSRRCAPMDYGPARSMRVPEDRYHFWDFESDSGRNHVLSLPAAQILSVEILPTSFDPATFVTWAPNWHVPRTSWGTFN